MNTLDMHVIAVDAKSGREFWKTEMFDYTAAGGYAATGAPLVVKDKVIVGMAGGEHGVSGFLDAYDATTGKRLWRFNTIPAARRAELRNLGRRFLEDRRRHHLEQRLLRSRNQHRLLGHQQSLAGLQRRLPQGRQSVLLLGAGARSRHRQAEVVLPVHAARHPRLGFHADPDPARRLVPRPRPQADGLGESQRLLLPARPERRQVPAGQELRPADLGQGLRRCRPPPGDPGQRADSRRATTPSCPAWTAAPTGCRTATAP